MQLTRPTAAIDLDAYFQRISDGADRLQFFKENRQPTLELLQAIHRCHPQAIAFENLNPLLQQPVSLDLPSLQQKLIHQRRGGYCFEQNLLLRSVLVSLGFPVTSLAARVMWNIPEDKLMPRTHMLLQVEVDGQPYVVDVGFGGMTLTAPLRLISDLEQETPHEPYRLVAIDPTYILQVKLDQTWRSLYSFDLQEQQLPDYEVSNWYVATHPDSLFVNNLVVAKPGVTDRYSLRNHLFSIHSLNGKTKQRQLTSVNELRTVLEDVFQLNLPPIDLLNQRLQQILEQS